MTRTVIPTSLWSQCGANREIVNEISSILLTENAYDSLDPESTKVLTIAVVVRDTDWFSHDQRVRDPVCIDTHLNEDVVQNRFLFPIDV